MKNLRLWYTSLGVAADITGDQNMQAIAHPDGDRNNVDRFASYARVERSAIQGVCAAFTAQKGLDSASCDRKVTSAEEARLLSTTSPCKHGSTSRHPRLDIKSPSSQGRPDRHLNLTNHGHYSASLFRSGVTSAASDSNARRHRAKSPGKPGKPADQRQQHVPAATQSYAQPSTDATPEVAQTLGIAPVLCRARVRFVCTTTLVVSRPFAHE